MLSQPGVKDEAPKPEFPEVESPKAGQPSPKQECLKLLEAIFDCLEVSDENRVLKESPKLQLLLYFDEAHTLTDEHSTWIVHNPDSWNAYEVLLSALNSFACPQVFSLFLSTNSRMSVLAPTPGQHKSSRAKESSDHLNAPFTELPFDCHRDLPVDLTITAHKQVTSTDVSKVEFMSKFGRPL